MNLSPIALSLIEAALSLARDDGPRFVAALKAHDWKGAARDLVVAELKLAAAAGAPGASVALTLVPVVETLEARPADPSSPAMARATGGEGGENVSTGA